jgi:DNA-binding NarL/FixJ family response regulator
MDMRRLGASGFISKSADSGALQDAVRTILGGGIVFEDDGETQTITDSTMNVWNSAVEPPTLAPRQLDVLRMLGEGATNKVIADRLNISENTVKSHLRSVFENLGVRTRTACVHKAVLLGLI